MFRIAVLIFSSLLVSGCYMANKTYSGKRISDGNPEKAIVQHHQEVANNAAQVTSAVSHAAKAQK